MTEDLLFKKEATQNPEKILTYEDEQLSILPVVRVDAESECSNLNILYCFGRSGQFKYNYKVGDLTFIISIYSDGNGAYEITRKTKEYGYAFVAESGTNISSMNLKRIIKSINNYYTSHHNDDRIIRHLYFAHTADAYTSKDIDAFRVFINEYKDKIDLLSVKPTGEAALLKRLNEARIEKRIKLNKTETVELQKLMELIEERDTPESKEIAMKKRRIAVRQNLNRVFKTEMSRIYGVEGLKVKMQKSNVDATELQFFY